MRKGNTLSISDSSSSPTAAGATRRRRRDQQQDHQNHEQGEVQQERAVVRGAPPTTTSAEVIQGHRPSSRGPLNKRIKHDQQLQQHLLMSSSLSSSPSCSKINITTFPVLEEKNQQHTNHETSKILGDEAASVAATPNYHTRIGTSGSGCGNPYIHAGSNTSSATTGPTILSNTSPGRQRVVSSTSNTPSSRLNILPSDPPQKSNRVVPLSLSSSSVSQRRYSPTAEGRRLSSLHDGHFSLSTTNPSVSSSPQPSPAAGRRNPRKLPLKTDVSSVEDSAFVAVGSNNHLPQQGSLSSTNTGGSAGQHLPGGQHSSSLAGSIPNADYHQSLVSAIFEIGLIEGSPLSIYENMSTRIKESYSDFNLEKIKSKLQKYRKLKSKNKEEFMQVYHKTLEDMLTAFPIPGSTSASALQTPLSLSSTIPLSILENLSSGEVAAHLTYEVMKEDACARMESNSSCDDIEAKHQQDEKQVKSHAPALSDRSSSSSLEKYLRNGNGSQSNKKFRSYSDASLLQQATNGFGDTLDFPTLTPDEHKSFIGKAFQHFLGLLSSLTCDIHEQRQAGAGGGNSISSEAGLTIASGGIPTSFAQHSWPAAANIINDPFGSSTSMMSTPFISTTPIMAAMNEWSAPPFILLNPSHYPLSNWHQHHQPPQQDQQEPLVSLQGDEQKHHHPSALSLHISSSSSSILAKSDEAGAALLAGLSVAPVGNEEVAHLSSHQQYSSGSRRDHYHNKDDQEQENDNTPKASNKSTFY